MSLSCLGSVAYNFFVKSHFIKNLNVLLFRLHRNWDHINELLLWPRQKYRKTVYILSCHFSHRIFILKHPTKHLRMEKYLHIYILLIHLFAFFFYRNGKKNHAYQSILQRFLSCLERTQKLSKNLSSSVYVTPCFSECFSFYVIAGRHYFE